MPEKDYYSFEEVLKNLKLEEDQLKRLVSAGEIRAFRDKNTMRFKAEDVDRLRGSAADELVLDDDLQLDLEEPAATPAAAAAAAPEVEELELGGDDLVLEEQAAPQVEELDLGADAAGESAQPTRGRSRVAAGAAAGTRRATRTAEPVEEASEGVGTKVMLVVGAVVLVFANCVIFDAFVGRGTNPLSKAVANLF